MEERFTRLEFCGIVWKIIKGAGRGKEDCYETKCRLQNGKI